MHTQSKKSPDSAHKPQDRDDMYLNEIQICTVLPQKKTAARFYW